MKQQKIGVVDYGMGNASLDTIGSQSNQTSRNGKRETVEEIYTHSLQEGKLSLSQNDFKNAKKHFLSAFSCKKTVEIAHLLSTCFSNLKEYEYASKFFEKNLDGFFVQPTIIEINDLKEIDEEVFGPILHIVRYSSDKMDNLVDEINNLNYGLTLGIHSRIDSTINFISNNVNVGNIYINRNITGAVVGSQPFGGRGLSGTGPKAGGPNYLLNLLNEKTLSNDITASGGNTSLLMLSDEND